MSTKTGLEKAAVLLKNLNPQVADLVLAQMDKQRAGKVRSEMDRVAGSPDMQQVLHEILLELNHVLTEEKPGEPRKTLPFEAKASPEKKDAGKSPSPASPGNGKVAPRGSSVDMVVEDDAAEPPPAKKPPSPEVQLDSDPLIAITQIPVTILARALQDENARTVTLILNLVDADRAGMIYKQISPEVRKQVSLQFAGQSLPNPEIMRRIAQAVVQKTKGMKEDLLAPDQASRLKKMASMIRQLDRADRMEMIAEIEKNDAVTAQGIKDQLYQFEDLLLLENSSIQKMLGDLDAKTLALALKGAASELQEKILGNLSKRAQDTLREEIDLNGNAGASKVDPARKTVLEALQRLDQAGELVMIS